MKHLDKIKLKALKRFVEERDSQKVRSLLETFHPVDISNEISKWNEELIIRFMKQVSPELSADVLLHFPQKLQISIIKRFTSGEIELLFEELDADEIVNVIEGLPSIIVKKILTSTSKEERNKVNTILRYGKQNAGYHMTVDYITIQDEWTIKKAIDVIKQRINKDDLEIEGDIFVTDIKNNLVGEITPTHLLSTNSKKKISTIMEHSHPVEARDNIGKVSKQIIKYEQSAVPIINARNKLIGVVYAEDIIEELQEIFDETSLDYAAIKHTTKDYVDQTGFELFKSRAFWIIILLFVGIFTQMIITGFQMIWTKTGHYGPNESIIVTSFLTLALTTSLSVSSSINDAAGNSGSQSASTLVRALALGEIPRKDYGKTLRKEAAAGAYLGLAAAAVSGIRLLIVWGIMSPEIFEPKMDNKWMIAVIMGITAISFFVAIVIGNLVGAVLPLIAHKYNKDGAIISGPVQTTIVDIVTMLVYLGLTTIVVVALSSGKIIN